VTHSIVKQELNFHQVLSVKIDIFSEALNQRVTGCMNCRRSWRVAIKPPWV